MAAETLHQHGFAVCNNIFSPATVEAIKDCIGQATDNRPAFRKNGSLFAIRRLLVELPQLLPLIFSPAFSELICSVAGNNYFVVKAIYFDKPEASNWFIAPHQDLTISVNKKVDLPGFGPWTVKPGQFAVQPPLSYLENIVTARIHLDDTDQQNGALYVNPASHTNGVVRIATLENREIVFCPVNSGGAMLMKPLLLHGSARTTNGNRRRVIHIEFSNFPLPEPLQWAEYQKW